MEVEKELFLFHGQIRNTSDLYNCEFVNSKLKQKLNHLTKHQENRSYLPEAFIFFFYMILQWSTTQF